MILYIANKMRLHKLPLKYEAFSRDTTEEAGSCDEMYMVVNSAHGCCFFKMTWSFGYVARLGIFKKAWTPSKSKNTVQKVLRNSDSTSRVAFIHMQGRGHCLSLVRNEHGRCK
jgi:hypothetical protein